MSEDLRTEDSITINASIAQVWEALTTPGLIKRWFFGVDTETDWSVGSPIVHRGEYLGKPYEDKGDILQIEPPRLLVHTHWARCRACRTLPRTHLCNSGNTQARYPGRLLSVSARVAENSREFWAGVVGGRRDRSGGRTMRGRP